MGPNSDAGVAPILASQSSDLTVLCGQGLAELELCLADFDRLRQDVAQKKTISAEVYQFWAEFKFEQLCTATG